MASLTQWTWFGRTPGVGDWQGGLVCCGSWGCKESDMTEQLNWTERPHILRLVKNPAPTDFVGPFIFLTQEKAPGLPWAQKIRVRPWPSTPVVAITTVPNHWEMAPPHLDAKLSHGIAFPRLQIQRGLSALVSPWLSVPMVFPTRGTVAGSGALQHKIHSPGMPPQVLQVTENLRQGKWDAVISQMFILSCKVSVGAFLVVQWLWHCYQRRRCRFSPWSEKIPTCHATWPKDRKKKKFSVNHSSMSQCKWCSIDN